MADEPIKPAKRTASLAPSGAHVLPQHVRQPALPPAGHQRDEELRRRTDTLQQAAEERADALGAHGFNPDVLAPDREILADFDGFEVSSRQPGFEYKWVPFDNPVANKGLMVAQAQTQGWQVVCGDMPEAKEKEIVGGMRKIGDTVLMRIPIERAEAIRARERQVYNAQHESAHSSLIELGKRRGITVKPIGEVGPWMSQMSARDRGAQAAKQKYEQGLREGTLNI
jgi:hypothetical protein